MVMTWWQQAVIYQIYPRSFADSDGDGVGDLPGIIERLDYLRWLGVDALWLSPIYPSPMADFGYDVADYTDIAPLFGTLADFDRLVEAAHHRELRVILDLVPNHTSDEHPWFVESRSSRDNPKRDWYIWRDPAPDGYPNNWRSYFGGPAWEWDAVTGQFYLHLFHRKQPDLNWRNPEVRQAMYGVMRFWFERGVDGFRIDVLWLLVKDEEFADNPPLRPEAKERRHWSTYRFPGFEDRTEVHEIVAEMRAVSDAYPERVLIGEIYLPVDRLIRYYGPDLGGIHLPFNFGLVTLDRWEAAVVEQVISAYRQALPAGAWPNWVLGNHDVQRIATRTGPDRSRLAQMLLLTLPGTLTCYYGDEIGMTDGDIPAERMVDPQSEEGRSRDVARTPMQWTGVPGAGFTAPDVMPWLPIDPSHRTVNVASQQDDPTSHLSLVRRLIQLRREEPALVEGSLEFLDAGSQEVLAYRRGLDGRRLLVVLNFRDAPAQPDLSAVRGEVVVSTSMKKRAAVSDLHLAGHEGLVIALD